MNGHFACLKYAHENGCPWDEGTCYYAAMNRHLACLKYAHEHGCPYNPEYRREIVRRVLLPKWRAMVRRRGIALYWHDRAGRSSYAPDGPGRKRDRLDYEADVPATCGGR